MRPPHQYRRTLNPTQRRNRLLLALSLLLTSWYSAAQTLPHDHNGQVVYRGQVDLPGLTQTQVLLRTVHYARINLMPYASCFAAQMVDTTHALVNGITGKDYWHGATPLRYELLLRAQSGGYTYEVSNLVTLTEVGPVAPETDPLAVHYVVEEKVEAVLDRADSYDRQHQPTPALQAYCSGVGSEVKVVLAHLRAEMAKP